jgi:ABC-type glycerol-3-phosphate transport system permease component
MKSIKKKRFSKNFFTYLILLLGLAAVVLPFWYMIVTALKPQSHIFEIPPRLWPQEITLKNFREAISKNTFGAYFLNSLFVAVTSTSLTVLVSSMLAYVFARMHFHGKEVLFSIFLVGMMIPPVMLIIPQFIITKQIGLFDSLAGLITVYISMNLATQTYLLRNFFEDFPRDMEEAALIDGASQWTIFTKLILPLSKPGLSVVTIFTFLYSWDEFPWANVAIKETSKRTLPIAIALFQTQHLTEWGQVFAASLIALVPVVIVYLIFQRYFVQGIATTGMKG